MNKVTVKVTRKIPTVHPIEQVTITMSGEEAYALAAVLCKIGGQPGTASPRGLTANISDALDEVGIRYDTDENTAYPLLRGSLCFNDYAK